MAARVGGWKPRRSPCCGGARARSAARPPHTAAVPPLLPGFSAVAFNATPRFRAVTRKFSRLPSTVAEEVPGSNCTVLSAKTPLLANTIRPGVWNMTSAGSFENKYCEFGAGLPQGALNVTTLPLMAVIVVVELLPVGLIPAPETYMPVRRAD